MIFFLKPCTSCSDIYGIIYLLGFSGILRTHEFGSGPGAAIPVSLPLHHGMEGDAAESPSLAALPSLTSSPWLGRVCGGIWCYFLLLPAAVWLSNGLSALRHATSSTSALFFSGFLGTCEAAEIHPITAALEHEWPSVTGDLSNEAGGQVQTEESVC